MSTYKTYVLIVAAGQGLRMESNIPKQYMDLEGSPVLVHTIRAFDTHDRVDEIVLVVPEGDVDFCKTDLLPPNEFQKKINVISGGIQRQDSVYNGLKYIGKLIEDLEQGIVLIHDGVRPFVSASMISRCIDHVIELGGCIPGIEANDTIKKVGTDSRILSTVDRKGLFLVQTPQGFRLDQITLAFNQILKKDIQVTDDASVMEMAGFPVYVIKGSKKNIKITTPDDLEFARFLLNIN